VDLHRAEVIRFNAPGPVAVFSSIQCGPGGNIYAIYSSASPLGLKNAPIRRISASSRSVTEYPIPAISGYEKVVRLSFHVGADGTLYALLRGNQSGAESKSAPVYLIAKYKDDGSLDSYLKIGEVPGKDVAPSSFAVFADGNSSLVMGITIEKTPDGTSPGVFSAIFDRNGVFRAPVTLMKLDAPAESSGSRDLRGAPPRTVQQKAIKEEDSINAVLLASSLNSVSSSDGNIYVFQGDGHLDIVSPVGSIEHEFKLRPPADGLSGVHMAAAGSGFLFVFYDHIATGEPGEYSQRHGMLTVVDPQAGEVAAIYRMPQAETDLAMPACATSLKDFSFLSSDDLGKLEVVHYLPN
jgi:hypothetical protein